MLNIAMLAPNSFNREGRRPSQLAIYAIIGVATLAVFWLVSANYNSSDTIESVTGRPGSSIRTICTDTCPFALDGVCQEGREPLHLILGSNLDGPYSVECDLGTDCSDCGPFEFEGPKHALSWTPIADLRKEQVEVNVRRTATPVPFFMPYTDPEVDTDVSAQMHNTALIEPGITWVWHKLLKDGCKPEGENGEWGLVLDVGANFGYYSLMSAAMGCNVIAWEPVPRFSAFFKYALLRNPGFLNAVELRERVVTDVHGTKATLQVPTTGIWGTAGIDGKNLDAAQRMHVTQSVTQKTERLDKVVLPLHKKRVLVLKADVEGFEAAVLSSAKGLFLEGYVDNVIMEYSPGVAEANQDWVTAELNPGRLLGLISEGYTILHINETLRILPSIDWEGSLPAMPYIYPDAVRHDIDDARRLLNGTLGCPLPAEVQAAGPLWECPSKPSSGGVFEFHRLSPKGFRPTFGYNTNIWASRSATSPGVKGNPASLFPQDENFDVEKWYTTRQDGRTYPNYPWHELRDCKEVAPHEQVMLRCKCSKHDVCGDLAKAVAVAARDGLMPPLPLERRTEPEEFKVAEW